MARTFLKPCDVELIELAERQESLLTRADLLGVGLSRHAIVHRVRSGRLHPVHPGVYALGHRAISRKAEFLAAVWWCGQGSALSHESAGAQKRWIREDPDHPPPIHVTTNRFVHSRPGVIVHRTRHLEARDVTRSGLLWLTTDARTLVDLADHLTYDALRAVADQLQELPTQRLIEVAARLPGRTGTPRTQRLIHSEDARARFALERRYGSYCDHHDIPHPDDRNVRLHGFRVDCWYAGPRLVVELDSRAHHARKTEMEADRLRDRALDRAGISVLRLMWHDLDPANALAARDLRLRLARAPVGV